MRKVIKNAALQWRERESPFEFNYENEEKDRGFVARVDADESGNPTLSVVSLKGYNEQYLKSRINQVFAELRAPQRAPGRGNIIYTRFSVNTPPALNKEVTLPANTYYYAVDNGLLSCNGDQLGKAFQAIYVGSVMEHCSLDREPITYTKYKLQ